MEYFLGSIITLLTFAIAAKLFYNKLEEPVSYNFSYSQSYIHDLLRFSLPTNQELTSHSLITQSIKHREKTSIRILMMNDMAYWIKDNTFYSAIMENGEIVPESTTKVDIMGMDKVQLKDMTFIVEELTRGSSDDSSNSR